MLISVVIPVFNEAEMLPRLLARLRTALAPLHWEVIFVNDGSTDRSMDIIRLAAMNDERIKAIGFSRNFGHQAAVTAGLDFAGGDAVVVMDADLQDPPELVPRMVELFERGYDVVSPRRVAREGETLFKRWTATLFYRAMAKAADQRIAADVGDFRLFSRRAVLALRKFREQHRFMRGLVAWLGLREAILPFERQPRVAGETKYPLLKMVRFAWTAMSSFSALPLRLSVAAGILVGFAGFSYLLRVLYLSLRTHAAVPESASIVVLQCGFSGMILVALGVIGDYVARNYEESKGRPLYVLTTAVNTPLPEYEIPRVAIVAEREVHDFEIAGLRRSASKPIVFPLGAKGRGPLS